MLPVEAMRDLIASEEGAGKVRVDVVVEEVRKVMIAAVVRVSDRGEGLVADVDGDPDVLELRLHEL